MPWDTIATLIGLAIVAGAGVIIGYIIGVERTSDEYDRRQREGMEQWRREHGPQPPHRPEGW